MEPGPREDIQIIVPRPDKSMTINVEAMTPGEPYSFLYREVEPAIAVRADNNSVRFTRVFETTRNPITRLVNKLREPILTTPPVRFSED